VNQSTTNDISQLLALARSGDPIAIGQLLGEYRGYLSVLARLQADRRLQAKFDASDAVQETLLHAHCHFDQFHGNSERELLAWLRRILSNEFTTLMRRYAGTQRRDIGREEDLRAEFDRSSQSLTQVAVSQLSSPSHAAIRREQGVLVANALEQLRKDYREVIVLRSVLGLPVAEVARRMARSPGNVEQLWLRALVSLRRTLE